MVGCKERSRDAHELHLLHGTDHIGQHRSDLHRGRAAYYTCVFDVLKKLGFRNENPMDPKKEQRFNWILHENHDES